MQKIKSVCIMLGLCALLSGCAAFSGGSSDVTDTYTTEFSDIPIPKDMSIEKGYTELSTTGSVRAGHMRFSGSVEWLSLINACIYNLHTQGWSPLAVYKHKNGLLVFEKAERICVMTFSESITSTTMYVWVCPRMKGFTVPPTMPAGPAPVEAVETYEEREYNPQTTDSYQPSPAAPQTGGNGLNEAGLSE
ncbi:MAG: hypothetical protein IJD04_00475 [Desulfovibrionaceae bacterium]|nr:hypothetical protein [Desulfovibrionaceae bacterium]